MGGSRRFRITLQSASRRSADSSPWQGEPVCALCLPCFRGGGTSGEAASDERVGKKKRRTRGKQSPRSMRFCAVAVPSSVICSRITLQSASRRSADSSPWQGEPVCALCLLPARGSRYARRPHGPSARLPFSGRCCSEYKKAPHRTHPHKDAPFSGPQITGIRGYRSKAFSVQPWP